MSKFSTTNKMDLAIERIMDPETGNADNWGSPEHMAFLIYLALECSDCNLAEYGEIEITEGEGDKVKKVKKACLHMPDGKPVTEVKLNWAEFTKEMTHGGTLAECANMKKFLSEKFAQLKTKERMKKQYV